MKLYSSLAEWWPLFSPPEEYAEEAAFYAKHLLAAGTAPANSLLELGSGGGNNASYLKKHFESATLVDLSPEMLAVSRRLNPDCEHVAGDMRSVQLGRKFDRVFVHDAICYMTTLVDLERAIRTAWEHLQPGGAALFAPDYVRETFRTGTDCGGSDSGRLGLRYLEWVHEPEPGGSAYYADYVCALRREDGSVDIVHERHHEGLFARAEWMEILERTGFEAGVVPFEHSEAGPLEVFVAVKPAPTSSSRDSTTPC
jgi:trans-aconitate methyltransferase